MAYANAVLADNPILYYRLNDAVTIADTSTSGTAGTPHGGVTEVSPGAVPGGGSIRFDGTTGYVTAPAVANLNILSAAFSVEAWVYFPSTAGAAGIVEKTVGGSINTQFLLFVEGGVYKWRLIQAADSASITCVGTAPAVQAWQHVCGTYDGANLLLYVNGSLIATLAATPAATGSGVTQLGMLGGNNYPLNGSLAEVAVYNYTLSPGRILAHYNAALNVRTVVTFVPAASTPAPATYTYLAYNAVTNVLRDEVPLTGVQFGTKLNSVGRLTGALGPMADPSFARRGLVSNLEPEQTALYVIRNGSLVWGGLLWRWDYDSQSDQMKVQAQTFESYFSRRLLRATKSYTGADVLTAVTDIVNTVLAVTGSLTMSVTSVTSGVTFTQAYNGYERRNIHDLINELSHQSNCFDWAVDVTYPSGVPTLTLTLSTPRRGRTAGVQQQQGTGLFWEYPGNIMHFGWARDGQGMATTVEAIGANNGPQTVIGSASAQSVVDSGYLVAEMAYPVKGQSDSRILGNIAAGVLQQVQSPTDIPTVVVDPGAEPVLGSYICGDEGRFRLTAPLFGATAKEAYCRITAIDVTPTDNGVHESAALTLGPTL